MHQSKHIDAFGKDICSALKIPALQQMVIGGIKTRIESFAEIKDLACTKRDHVTLRLREVGKLFLNPLLFFYQKELNMFFRVPKGNHDLHTHIMPNTDPGILDAAACDGIRRGI